MMNVKIIIDLILFILQTVPEIPLKPFCTLREGDDFKTNQQF